MLYRAMTSFSGILISMRMGEVRDISDPLLADDLMRAGYIMEEVAKPVAEPPKDDDPPQKKKGRKKSGK